MEHIFGALWLDARMGKPFRKRYATHLVMVMTAVMVAIMIFGGNGA